MSTAIEVNPFSLPRPATRQETKIFTDPLFPEGVQITVTLRSLVGTAAVTRIGERASEYVEKYVTTGAGKRAAPIILPGIGKVKPTRTLLDVIARIEEMEIVPEGATRGLLFWLATSEVAPTAFLQISQWADELGGETYANRKNVSGASSETPSGDASTTMPDTIPSS